MDRMKRGMGEDAIRYTPTTTETPETEVEDLGQATDDDDEKHTTTTILPDAEISQTTDSPLRSLSNYLLYNL